MAELKCSDGTVIKISKETEDELRKAFGDNKPRDYKNGNLRLRLDLDLEDFPIILNTDGDNDEAEITRDVEDAEAFREALTEMIEYCKKHNLGV